LKLPPEQQKFLPFECHFRELVVKAAGAALTLVVQALVDQFDAAFEPRPGQRFVQRRLLAVTGLFGLMSIRRDYYFDGQQGHCPADAALGLETAYTPALSRLLCRAAAQTSYQEASADLLAYAGVEVGDRQIQRLVQAIAPDLDPWLQRQQGASPNALVYVSADGTGVPMRKEVLVGRKGKQPDGSAKTQEVKLGCVFLQTEVDAQGHPVRQEASTSYIGSFVRAEEFGRLLRQEAHRRGIGHATTVVFIGDGAAWVWELARVNFPGAVLILDFYHAAQHVHALVTALFGEDSLEGKRRLACWKKWLLKDQAAEVITAARAELVRSLDTETARKAIGYLENNLARMQYGTFRKAGYFIGSGVVEAGCKTVVGKRMKCSGMFWSEAGGQGILDLRCAFMSDRLDPFFEARTAQYRAGQPAKHVAA
jgi:hypothetical protein